MSKRDVGASVRQKLLNEAHHQMRPFQELLQYFAMERFLYRLSISPHRDHFILKGALLMTAWHAPQARPTVDIDLAGRTSNDPEHIRRIIQEICSIEVSPDGIHFDPATVKVARIKEDAEYEGVRARSQATLSRARIEMQIDIGFGDIVVPKPRSLEYPVILNFPAPVLLGYPRETVIAEKLQALTMLGILNSRLKDYFDIWLLSRLYSFEGATLADAIRATFENRSTPVDPEPPGLTEIYSSDPARLRQWSAFQRRNRISTAPETLPHLVQLVRDVVEHPYSPRSPATCVSNQLGKPAGLGPILK
ncbi:MAG: nucleotidyl transferase AbiEii/AbiGii toxin family protein [Acidobacteria bacterium]|nr:MAG: nucleotidyl transferase AbiEii/AbiGii toxin family protein [Acidobacteriota bacterium]